MIDWVIIAFIIAAIVYMVCGLVAFLVLARFWRTWR